MLDASQRRASVCVCTRAMPHARALWHRVNEPGAAPNAAPGPRQRVRARLCPWYLKRYAFLAFLALAAVAFAGNASFWRAKYQTACTSVPLNCSSERSALPLRLSACCCASTGFVANVFIVDAGGCPVTVEYVSHASW